MKNCEFDIIVVGAGHAGCEAASAAALLGSRVLIVTIDLTKIAQMSCNPAIGGIAKGQIVREIDALGGFTGIVTDKSMIQFRMLNKSKGPAMWSPRAQCDRVKFSIEWRKILEKNSNISFWQDIVTELLIEDHKVKGIKTQFGITFYTKAIILTTGTFQNGLIYIGRKKISGGRISEPSGDGISDQMKEYGFEVGRMKTGTPARIDGRTIDFNILEEQKGEESGKFSYLSETKKNINVLSCYITYTNKEVHNILEKGFKDSPLYNGSISGIGPRYCPSIEDKIVTFFSKENHQLFIEPEGCESIEYYLNGFSSSLPWDIQYNAINKIKGLENARIFRPGYAIEYDYYPPTQLLNTLETKYINGLYFAGQINGTTGYEEAAAQGLIAGINANKKINNEKEFILGRDEAYIGVLIDDLITKGVDEPYRMFTSRAEFRISLRQDNADERLTERSYNIGLASADRVNRLIKKEESKKKLIKYFKELSIKPSEINKYLKKVKTRELKKPTKLYNLILRPQINLIELIYYLKNEKVIDNFKVDNELFELLNIQIKYNGYIEREKIIAIKSKRLENIQIPENFDYKNINSISTEAKIKLGKIKPRSIGQASRISGVSPSDINILLINMGR